MLDQRVQSPSGLRLDRLTWGPMPIHVAHLLIRR